MATCPVCRNVELDDHGDLRRCRSCGHVFEHPARVTVRYDAAYVANYERLPTREMSYLRLGFVRALLDSGRLLDVGHGNGAFVRLAAAAGFAAYGCDVHGVPCGINEVDLAQDRSHWDIVTLFDSLEHFPQFDVLRALFARATYVVVSLPWTPERFPAERDWKHYKPGEHLHYFSLHSLTRLIGKARLRQVDLEDVIRRDANRPNILTAAFGPTDASSQRRQRRHPRQRGRPSVNGKSIPHGSLASGD